MTVTWWKITWKFKILSSYSVFLFWDTLGTTLKMSLKTAKKCLIFFYGNLYSPCRLIPADCWKEWQRTDKNFYMDSWIKWPTYCTWLCHIRTFAWIRIMFSFKFLWSKWSKWLVIIKSPWVTGGLFVFGPVPSPPPSLPPPPWSQHCNFPGKTFRSNFPWLIYVHGKYFGCHKGQGNTATEQLTHWGRVTHICVGKPIIIGSDNGLSPGRRQAIIWTKVGAKYFSKYLSQVQVLFHICKYKFKYSEYLEDIKYFFNQVQVKYKYFGNKQ